MTIRKHLHLSLPQYRGVHPRHWFNLLVPFVTATGGEDGDPPTHFRTCITSYKKKRNSLVWHKRITLFYLRISLGVSRYPSASQINRLDLARYFFVIRTTVSLTFVQATVKWYWFCVRKHCVLLPYDAITTLTALQRATEPSGMIT